MLNYRFCLISLDVKSNTFTFMFFPLFGTQTPAYESSILLQIQPHLLTITVNGGMFYKSLY